MSFEPMRGPGSDEWAPWESLHDPLETPASGHGRVSFEWDGGTPTEMALRVELATDLKRVQVELMGADEPLGELGAR